MSAKRKSTANKRKRPKRDRVVRKQLEEIARNPSRLTAAERARLDAMSEEDIARQIAENPDAPEFTDEMFAQATWVEPPSKQLFSLRLDRDVLEWYRDSGKNYQSRMNAVLRSYMQHHKRG